MAPRVGFEPTTDRLTVDCSTTELPRNISHRGRPKRQRERFLSSSYAREKAQARMNFESFQRP